jgi:hypothetical protein
MEGGKTGKRTCGIHADAVALRRLEEIQANA